MVYFENAFRWFFFYHNLKMRGLSCRKKKPHFMVQESFSKNCAVYEMVLKSVVEADSPQVTI
jgi:hypothetical protein